MLPVPPVRCLIPHGLAVFLLGWAAGLSAHAGFVSTVEQELPTRWLGFGYNQWGYPRQADGHSFRPWDDASWRTTRERILAIHPALVRMPLVREWFNGDDRRNPLPPGRYQWDSEPMRAFYRSMDLYREQNIPVLSGLWGAGNGTGPDVWTSRDFITVQADLIEHLIRVKGYTNLAWYTPVNEPRGSWPDYAMWAGVITNLHAELVRRKLPANLLTGADSWAEWEWLPARENRAQLSSYEFHAYLNDTPDDTLRALRERRVEAQMAASVRRIRDEDPSDKPVFLGEMAPIGVGYIDWPKPEAPAHVRVDTWEYGLGWWDYGIQLARAGLAGGLAWGLDGFDAGKNAGMWNNSGNHGGWTLRPWYYTWQLMCRYFPAGSRILRMSEPADTKDLRILGARVGERDYSFAIVNRATGPDSQARTVVLKAPGGAKVFYVYDYHEGARGDGTSLSLPHRVQRTDDLAGSGITVTVGRDAGVLLTTLPPLGR